MCIVALACGSSLTQQHAVSSAVSDIAVAIVLVFFLRKVKTGFRSTKGYAYLYEFPPLLLTSIISLVQRLSTTALKSGSATASIATVRVVPQV